MTREKDKSYKGISYLTFDNHKKRYPVFHNLLK